MFLLKIHTIKASILSFDLPLSIFSCNISQIIKLQIDANRPSILSAGCMVPWALIVNEFSGCKMPIKRLVNVHVHVIQFYLSLYHLCFYLCIYLVIYWSSINHLSIYLHIHPPTHPYRFYLYLIINNIVRNIKLISNLHHQFSASHVIWIWSKYFGIAGEEWMYYLAQKDSWRTRNLGWSFFEKFLCREMGTVATIVTIVWKSPGCRGKLGCCMGHLLCETLCLWYNGSKTLLKLVKLDFIGNWAHPMTD